MSESKVMKLKPEGMDANKRISKKVFLSTAFVIVLLHVYWKAQKEKAIRSYHFVLLRQVMENVASFLGVGRFGYILDQIGIDGPEETAKIINTLSHKNVYHYESDELVPDTQETFEKVFNGLKEKYQFVLHAE